MRRTLIETAKVVNGFGEVQDLQIYQRWISNPVGGGFLPTLKDVFNESGQHVNVLDGPVARTFEVVVTGEILTRI